MGLAAAEQSVDSCHTCISCTWYDIATRTHETYENTPPGTSFLVVTVLLIFLYIDSRIDSPIDTITSPIDTSPIDSPSDSDVGRPIDSPIVLRHYVV